MRPKAAGVAGFVFALATIVLVYWTVVPVGMAILATHRPRAEVQLADLGRPYEEVTLRTSDGLELAVWYVPSRNGAAVMVYGEVADSIQGAPQPLYQRPRFFGEAQWRAYGERLDAFGKYLLSKGVRLAYHHHMGAYVETPDDVDKLMSVTNADVGLLYDTGHMTFAGGDAVAMLEKHVDRVCHVHCKDVRPYVIRLARNRNWSFLEAVINGAFTVPGDGAVDFPGVLAVLHDHGYRGWLVVEAEQDPAKAHPLTYAKLGYRNLLKLATDAGFEVVERHSTKLASAG